LSAGRHAWAVELLGLGGGERVLEVGCGAGVTASLVCERLPAGRLLAIDRSSRLAAQAARRNAGHVAARRAEFRTARPEDLGAEIFDRVFSMNVRELWEAPDAIAGRVAPGGTAVWVFELPSWDRAMAAARTGPLVDLLARHGGRSETLTSDAAFAVRWRPGPG
jgi:trans-aconitate methyltransferase